MRVTRMRSVIYLAYSTHNITYTSCLLSSLFGEPAATYAAWM